MHVVFICIYTNSRVIRRDFSLSERGIFDDGGKIREEIGTTAEKSDGSHISPHGSDRCRTFFSVTEPKKDKTEQSANGAISPCGGGGRGEPQAANLGMATIGPAAPVPASGGQQKPNRPNTLDPRVVARRLILFDSEYRRVFIASLAYGRSLREKLDEIDDGGVRQNEHFCDEGDDNDDDDELGGCINLQRQRERERRVAKINNLLPRPSEF